MKFSTEELEASKKIAILSYEKEDSVTKVLKAFFLYSAMELFSGKEEIILPSIGKMKLTFEDTYENGKLVKKPNIAIEPSEYFSKHLSDAKVGNLDNIAEEVRGNIRKTIKDIIES